MKYISRAIVSKENMIRFNLVDSYSNHCRLYECIDVKQDRDFLFCVDQMENGLSFTLVSNEIPPSNSLFTWTTKEIDPSFFDNDSYMFSLKVNPTIKRNATRERVAVLGEENLIKWIERKACESGFNLEEVNIDSVDVVTFRKKSMKGLHNVVSFSGVLTVIDKEKFTNAVNAGIGTAKGFGYGMLKLKPVAII